MVREDLPPGKMYSCSEGMRENADILVLKFFAITSFGTCASQSVSYSGFVLARI